MIDIILLFVLPLLILLLMFKVLLLNEQQKLLDMIASKQTKYYLEICFNNFSLSNFQIIRIMASLFLAVIYQEEIFGIIITFFLIYFLFYIVLVLFYNTKIKQINQAIPYFMKSVIYLCYQNPINNALIKAVNYGGYVLEKDVSKLVDDIIDDPNSFEPYQKIIDKYNNEIKNLEFYFKNIYRLSQSGYRDGYRILENLNTMISEDLNNVRKQKNDAINETIGYLGMLPVVFLIVGLFVILLVTINNL